MTTQITDRSSARPVGPPPPFDPELAPVIEILTSVRSPDAYRPDNIVEMRKPVPGVETPTDEVLARSGSYSVQERTVSGPDGAPDISLLICLPKHAATPTPAIYHIHGGGMIVGDNRFGGRLELHVWPGGFHGFDVVVPHAVISQDAIAARVAWLRRQLVVGHATTSSRRR